MCLRHCLNATILFLLLQLHAAPSLAEVVAVVSQKSAVAALTQNQVADIFLGRTSQFPDGNQAVPIDQGTGKTRDDFYKSFTGKSVAQIKAHWSKILFTGRGTPPREVAGDDDVKKFLAANPSAIGYINRNAVDDDVKVVSISP